MNRVLVAALATAFLVGCDSTYSFDLTTEPHGSIIDEQGITVIVGNAVGVTPLENDDRIDFDDTTVELFSTNADVMEIAPTGEVQEFVLWGVSAGLADVEVVIDGELDGFIEVEVLPRER